ncbi:exonuclease SbcCD subunit D [Parapedobacter koreensis]|uniref:Nuclease SbcCD subunit D n=1 Tax=Parapedobacter koreensis TaxID=332977 RepID=A0A1H7U522_9SPHI|nr:exonuclease SbcCD subunit D C-terminal domain-containing protein [Parapedobacter koreensis]SEL91859.1 Exodeoxyribonuclease I subunit D [Parapedobacter koreensis]
MNILHTADWHLGQLFHEYDRTYEHQQFLDWLVQTLQREAVDVLLISGDVFDLSNPSAATIRQFYTFLNKASKACPDIQIVVTAGNHDSASRLEAPKPLLESSNIHIIGTVAKDDQGNIDADKLIIPLSKDGDIKAWCLAVPFLRMGDYPAIADCDNPYAEGVTALYRDLYEAAKSNQQPGQAIIAMGHLHARGAETSDMDKAERLIMGGVECISAAAFPEDIAYVALGHIHKAQRLGGKEHIRYCGSPLPMSFSEINYKHQVILFTIEDGQVTPPRGIEVPVTVPLLKVPSIHSRVEEVLLALQQLHSGIGKDRSKAPYIQVCVLAEGPEPGLRHKVEQALADKHVRFARIDTRYPAQKDPTERDQAVSSDQLQALKPVDVFKQVYQSRYSDEVPKALMALFNEVAQQVYEKEGGDA